MMPDLRFFSRRGIKSASSPCASPSLRLMARMRTRSSKIFPSATIESRLHFSRSKTFKRSSWALDRSDFNLTSFSIVCVSVRRVLRTVFTSLLLKHTYGLSFVMSCCPQVQECISIGESSCYDWLFAYIKLWIDILSSCIDAATSPMGVYHLGEILCNFDKVGREVIRERGFKILEARYSRYIL